MNFDQLNLKVNEERSQVPIRQEGCITSADALEL